MIVRRATLGDAKAMARVHWLSSNKAYGRDDPFDSRLEAAHAVLQERGMRSFVAEEDGETLGVLSVDDDELHAIYVLPERWGSGVGQRLLERAEAELATTCDEAQLTVLVGNRRARSFYERNGWDYLEHLTERHFGGIPTEVCRYRKRLRSPSSDE